MKKLILVMIIFTIVSCKEETKRTNESNINEEKLYTKPEELVISIDFKTDREDDFKLIMNNIVIDEFQKKNIQVFETIPKSSGYENMTVKFDPGNLSNTIFFSLGNKNEKTVEMKYLNITYDNKVLKVDNGNFDKYFRLNNFITKDSLNLIFTTKRVEGKHNPVIFSKKPLVDFLKKQP